MDYQALAHAYGRHRRINPLVLQRLAQRGAVNERSTVLEVGCGTGNYIGALQQMSGAACCGVDPSSAMLALAVRNNPAVDFRLSTAESLAFDQTHFDLIYSVDVIHHVQDRGAYFRQLRQRLSGGGHICTVTDSAGQIRRRHPLSTYFPETVAADRARYPTVDLLQRLMEQSGFDELDSEEVTFSYVLESIESYRARAFSCLHLISDEAFRRGLTRLEADMAAGPLTANSCYTLIWGAIPPPGGGHE